MHRLFIQIPWRVLYLLFSPHSFSSTCCIFCPFPVTVCILKWRQVNNLHFPGQLLLESLSSGLPDVWLIKQTLYREMQAVLIGTTWKEAKTSRHLNWRVYVSDQHILMSKGLIRSIITSSNNGLTFICVRPVSLAKNGRDPWENELNVVKMAPF